MTVSRLILITLLLVSSASSEHRFPDAQQTPPEDWKGPVFRLSQDYPSQAPPREALPWAGLDFRTQPQEYAEALLAYAQEGNLEVDWVVQDNKVRRWYHAPWMHYGPRGREFIRGLTKERTSRAYELSPHQSTHFDSYAVSFYNPAGGYVLGQVWSDPGNPDLSKARFPNGTVVTKLLFSRAHKEEVPYLRGAPVWEANISPPDGPREVGKVRLVQFDMAVRDDRADFATGWVFVSFAYRAGSPQADPWKRLIPVGLSWGNDPDRPPGSSEPVEQTWLNPDLKLHHYGWEGRLNGPVDNPVSSCLSCHSTAQFPAQSPMTVSPGWPAAQKMRWFRNLKPGEPFDPGSESTDYSFQLSMGVDNLQAQRSATAQRAWSWLLSQLERW